MSHYYCQTCARNSAVYYVTPAVDIKYLQIRLRIRPNNYALTGNEPQIFYNSVNQPAGDYIKITYTTDEAAIAIQEQTTIIEQQTDEIINLLDQDHTYNNNPSENIDGQDEIDTLTDEQEDLMDQLDFSMEDMDITINPHASEFIWEVVRLLRSINGKIVLLFASVLGLGIMKMILNR